MRYATLVNVGLFALVLAGGMIATACTVTTADSGGSSGSSGKPKTKDQDATTKPGSETGIPDGPLPPGSAPRPPSSAGTTEIPKCTSYVDAAGGGDGTAASPFKTIASAVEAAKNGAIICVAEGTYSGEQLAPGEKFFTVAGGFQKGKEFKVRDSAQYPTLVKGGGSGSFYKADDPAPKESDLVVFDGLDISGYAQAISRATYFMGRMDITNNIIHDNDCQNPALIGAAVSLSNIKGTIKGNVFKNNTCGRGGAVAMDDTLNKTDLTFTNNLIQNNSGTEPESSHGGAVYLFANKLVVSANVFTDNEVTGWGGGLFVGSNNGGGQQTNASLSWNVYRNNKAGINGGGLFCDDSAACNSEHEIYDGNCGGNVYVDSGPDGSGPTKANFSYMTNVNAKEPGCGGAGSGFIIDHGNDASDAYTITNSIFWGNGDGKDFFASCGGAGCSVSVNVTYSMVQKDYVQNGVTVTFGAGIMTPTDPQFVDASKVDFHLQSTNGHWTPTGYVNDSASSPALGKGNGSAPSNPAKAGSKPELGAFGNSGEASYTQ